MKFEILSLSISTVIAIAGWFIAYSSKVRQDAKNKRKEIRVNYLIKTWPLLESLSNRENKKNLKNLEKVVADIQLFGSKEQIKLVQEIAEDMRQGKADTLSLLKNLREDLRKELDLEKVPDTLKFIRVIE
jgi:hypothetical protein